MLLLLLLIFVQMVFSTTYYGTSTGGDNICHGHPQCNNANGYYGWCDDHWDHHCCFYQPEPHMDPSWCVEVSDCVYQCCTPPQFACGYACCSPPKPYPTPHPKPTPTIKPHPVPVSTIPVPVSFTVPISSIVPVPVPVSSTVPVPAISPANVFVRHYHLFFISGCIVLAFIAVILFALIIRRCSSRLWCCCSHANCKCMNLSPDYDTIN